MKIKRGRDGGLSISIPREELEGMALNARLMKGDASLSVSQITNKIHFELMRMIAAPTEAKARGIPARTREVSVRITKVPMSRRWPKLTG